MPLASSIDGKDHIKVFDEIAAERLSSLELDNILIYLIDTVDSRALPYLASQLNVAGLRGWNAAKTDKDRRELLKRAIELARYAGTPYAIRQSLRSVGYADATISEGTGAYYNGIFLYDGFINYGAGVWATFSVLLDLGESKGINTVENQEAIDLINEWKNQRSQFMGLFYQVSVSDTIIPRESDSDFLNIDMVTEEGVDPLTEAETLEIVNAEVSDNYPAIAENLVLNLLDSQGNVIDTFVV